MSLLTKSTSDKQTYTEGLRALNINYFLIQLALGMVSIFGVLFVFRFGENMLHGLFFVVSYFMLQRIATVVSIPLTANLISRVGYRRMILAGLVFMAIRFGLLALVTINNIWILIPSAFFGGLSFSSYYISFHGLFLDDNDDNKIGEQASTLEILNRISAVFGPFVAGLIIAAYGFPAMFGVVIFLLIVSLIPIMRMPKHKRHKSAYSLPLVVGYINNNPKVTLSTLFWQITTGILVFYWPIYLFLQIRDYKTLGIVVSAIMVFNGLAVLAAGKIYDKKKYKCVFLVSSMVVAFGWIIRLLTALPLTVVGDFISRVASPVWWMKIRRKELIAGEKVDSLVFGAAHELTVSFGYIIALGLSASLLIVSNANWSLVLIFVLVCIGVSTYTIKDE